MRGIVLLLILLAGCAYIPKDVAECSTLFDTTEAIDECEEGVATREDRHYKKKQKRLLDELAARACWIERRGIWNRNTGRCVDPWSIGMN